MARIDATIGVGDRPGYERFNLSHELRGLSSLNESGRTAPGRTKSGSWELLCGEHTLKNYRLAGTPTPDLRGRSGQTWVPWRPRHAILVSAISLAPNLTRLLSRVIILAIVPGAGAGPAAHSIRPQPDPSPPVSSPGPEPPAPEQNTLPKPCSCH